MQYIYTLVSKSNVNDVAAYDTLKTVLKTSRQPLTSSLTPKESHEIILRTTHTRDKNKSKFLYIKGAGKWTSFISMK